ncbi:DedA family protein [Faecalicatena contorta]|jgi:alkaline phosphatase|uniref:Membrane protein DedA, SNARE-associated domain n=1 Tax=Faecalicatena contorta TaxID=39482 RepID=A0A315ZP05_9FIRM|nr:DedA family protein [Faecalicatena contorta]MBA4699490.1 DedA family protein [Ruminococcus sp.]PWJ47019.1 membrane protein DedA with SNARE-associated domain [Faecalicatena contorta]SUQ16231.1 membrane protein DedA, SNARE-associated domain [Faecalicatena contorta]
MQEFIIRIMDQFGYLGVCFLIAVENILPPIPSEVILTFGGFMTTYTRLTVPGVIIFSTLGSTIGALVLYWIGTALNPERLDKLTKGKAFRMLGFEKADMEKTIGWFDKHGKKAILFGRCIPIIRSLVSVPAGMAEINMPVFLTYTIIGSTVWNILLVSLGAILGASWEVVLVYIARYSAFIKAALFIGVLFLVIRLVKKKIS